MKNKGAVARLVAPESKMEVRLLKRPKRKGVVSVRADQITQARRPFFVKVCLYSDVKQRNGAQLFSFADIEMGHGFRKRIEAAGGALAEYQNERYKDQHDPSHCARTARELAIDLLRHA